MREGSERVLKKEKRLHTSQYECDDICSASIFELLHLVM